MKLMVRFIILLILPFFVFAEPKVFEQPEVATQTFDAFIVDIKNKALEQGVSQKTLTKGFTN